MNISMIYCNNCGNIGHIYRQCRLPVLSYGVICINKENKVLMIQRKDSLSYIEFLRGKYELNDDNYILSLLNGCSLKERELIKNTSFDKLWEILWFSGKEKKKQTDRMIKEYTNSKYKFETLGSEKINNLIKKCTIHHKNPEWEIPKGRRNNHESNIKCAIREFQEETDINKDEYILLENVNPISEEFVGSNGVRYKHIYYYAFYKGNRDLSINKDKYEQYSEIGDIRWLSLNECLSKLRESQKTKKDIILIIKGFIVNWSEDFVIKE